jgi:hypothetical protein
MSFRRILIGLLTLWLGLMGIAFGMLPALCEPVSFLAGLERERDRLRPLVPELFGFGGHGFIA